MCAFVVVSKRDGYTMNRPLLIVITPVRNEAWVLEAFLTHTSSWADYIIIVDQHSTDGSREIASRFEKVILLDNPTQEWYEMEARALLLERASQIPGDKIIFGLDADEFLSAGFEKTQGWKTIMEMPPNVVFQFRWLNLFDNYGTVEYYKEVAEWACHYDEGVDIVAEYRKREKHAVHACRVPCLEEDRTKYITIDDIRFVHLAKLNKVRTQNKLDFYQVTWADKNQEKAKPITFYRGYNDFYPLGVQYINNPVQLTCMGSEVPINDMVKTADIGQHYIDEMVAVFKREGTDKFIKLGIWDNPHLAKVFPIPHRPFYVKQVHSYLRATQNIHRKLIIRAIDKVLKRFFQ